MTGFRGVVLRSLLLSSVVVGLVAPAAPVSAGPAIDLPRLDIHYDYDPPLDGHGYWVGDPQGGEWRVVGGGLDRDDRLTLEVEIRPPAISVPLEPGPAVLFGTVGLFGDAGGDVATGASVPRTLASVLPPCPDPADCVYRGSITLPTDRLPRLAERVRNAEDWISAVIGLTLVRTFAQGTWLQVLPLYDEQRDEPDGRVGRPRHISSRMLALGASPVGPRELWSRRDRPVLDRIERLRRSIEDPSALPETEPLLVDIETAPCTPGWTIATATGDVLVDVTEPGPSVPVKVEAPVGAEWTVSVPSIDRAQGTGDAPRTYGPFSSDEPGLVSGQVAGDPYECQGVEPGSVTWRAATADEVTSFAEGDPASLLETYRTLPARDLPAASTTSIAVPSARQALECDFKGLGADSGRGNWEGDSGYASPREALQVAIAEGAVIPQAGYRALARNDTAVLYGYTNKGEVKVAVRVRTVGGDEAGWLPERLISCRVAEFGPKADMGRGVWLWANRWGRTVQERVGPGHCDWQSARFLYWAPPGTPATATRLYVRDPRGVFGDRWTMPFLRSTTLPSDARYTGFRRDGKALWLAADERAMYVKDGDRVERWPRIPTGTGCA